MTDDMPRGDVRNNIIPFIGDNFNWGEKSDGEEK
jgi:hypothetical protein